MEDQLMKTTKCHECSKEIGTQAIGRHYKVNHGLSLLDKPIYLFYVEYNFPGLIEKIKNDILTYKYMPTTIHTEKEYVEYGNLVFRVSKFLDLNLDKEQKRKAKGERIKKTKLIKYGDATYNNIEKTKQTNSEKYGVDYAWCLPEIREQIFQTNIKNYGNKFGSQEFIDKMGGFAKDKDLAVRAGKIAQQHPKVIQHQQEFFKSEKFKAWKFQWAIDNPEKAAAHRLAWARTSKFHCNIKKQFEENGINTQSEYRILRYFVDEFDDKTNTCIEFFGDYWHCNPNKYSADFIHPEIKLSAEEIWQRDQIRLNKIKKEGYNIFIIWESDDFEEKIKEYKRLYQE